MVKYDVGDEVMHCNVPYIVTEVCQYKSNGRAYACRAKPKSGGLEEFFLFAELGGFYSRADRQRIIEELKPFVRQVRAGATPVRNGIVMDLAEQFAKYPLTDKQLYVLVQASKAK